MDEDFFDGLRERIACYFESGGSHDFSHTGRVYGMAVRLAEGEDVDLDIVRAAALLHDVAREKEIRGEVDCHAEEGAKMARDILSQRDDSAEPREVGFDEDKIGKVVDAIRVHRYTKGLLAESREAEILQDADRLDALGAITIGRMFTSGGRHGRELYNPEVVSGTTIAGFYNRILKMKPEGFNTAKARRIAKDRYDYVVGFVDRFEREWVGEL